MAPITLLLADAIQANLLEAGDDADEPIREQRRRAESDATDSADSEPERGAVDHNDPEASHRQLQALVLRMRAASGGQSSVEAAYREYTKIKDQARKLCRMLLCHLSQSGSQKGDSSLKSNARHLRVSSMDSTRKSAMPGPLSPLNTQSPPDAKRLSEAWTTQNGLHGKLLVNVAWLSAIREWKTCLEQLAETLKTALAESYRSYEPEATSEMVEALFGNKEFRSRAIVSMQHTGGTKNSNLSKSDLRKYDRVKHELDKIRGLFQTAESGIAPDREIQEYVISPRGDAVLEFANTAAEARPVLRFLVSSHMLAETSPIFARMFSGDESTMEVYDGEDIEAQLPPPPTRYVCQDGSEVNLYRMPQLELNRKHALEVLLHAAHMHNDLVPRDISFQQFVAIAEVCMRYKCTSPVELFVEHRWMPAWMHKASEDMPDGLLLISYVFGTRGFFTRMSKTAILNIKDDKELQGKPWPQKVKDKIAAVRSAKIAQVHACCISAVQEYLRSPARPEDGDARPGPLLAGGTAPEPAGASSTPAVAPSKPVILTSTPRCPKGSHWCDATNLGWLMLVYAELQVLPTIVRPQALGHLAHAQPPPRSLAQVVDALRTAASPPQPVHRGVCDPAPAFRTAINDIYNSVSGLTLFDVSGRSHGWALSRHLAEVPQAVLLRGFQRAASGAGAGTEQQQQQQQKQQQQQQREEVELPDGLRLRVLAEVDTLEDLHVAARINRGFYATYKRNELALMRNIVRADRRRTLNILTALGGVHAVDGAGEGKSLKSEADHIREAPAKVNAEDGGNFPRSEFEEDEEVDDDSTLDKVERDEEDEDEADTSVNPRPPSSTEPQAASAGPSSAGEQGSPSGLTEEEAQRILWPDTAGPSNPPPSPPESPERIVDRQREKFRADDPGLAENKTLAVLGDKQLRDEHDLLVGRLRDVATTGWI